MTATDPDVDFILCNACSRRIEIGDAYCAGSEVDICAECSPFIADLLDYEEPGFVNEDGSDMTQHQRRALYDELIAAGHKPSDKFTPDRYGEDDVG